MHASISIPTYSKCCVYTILDNIVVVRCSGSIINIARMVVPLNFTQLIFFLYTQISAWLLSSFFVVFAPRSQHACNLYDMVNLIRSDLIIT